MIKKSKATMFQRYDLNEIKEKLLAMPVLNR